MHECTVADFLGKWAFHAIFRTCQYRVRDVQQNTPIPIDCDVTAGSQNDTLTTHHKTPQNTTKHHDTNSTIHAIKLIVIYYYYEYRTGTSTLAEIVCNSGTNQVMF